MLTATGTEVSARSRDLAEANYKQRMRRKNGPKAAIPKFDPVKAKVTVFPDANDSSEPIVYLVGCWLVVSYTRDGLKHFMPVSRNP